MLHLRQRTKRAFGALLLAEIVSQASPPALGESPPGAAAAVPVAATSNERPASAGATGTAGNITGVLPDLIQKQPASVRRAWTEVNALIRENAVRTPPLPFPYLARAELWSLVGAHEEALEDTLAALAIARRSNATMVEQSRYLTRIQGILEQVVHAPRPQFQGDAATQFSAGLNQFHEGAFGRALAHFDSAVQLEPGDKTHWYFRALTNKHLGRDQDAERDINVAVYLEKSEVVEPASSRKRWLDLFTRVQGPLRQWMEAYRTGSPLAASSRLAAGS